MSEDGKIGSYFSGMKDKISPKDPFSHAAWLLQPDEASVFDVHRPVVSKQTQLANIEQDQFIRFYQNDAVILTQMRELAAREPALEDVYETIVHGWEAELLITKMKGGLERQLQGTTGGSYIPRSDFSGYGADFAAQQQQQDQQHGNTGNAVMDFFKNLRRKKQ